jgi:hypothetical protein
MEQVMNCTFEGSKRTVGHCLGAHWLLWFVCFGNVMAASPDRPFSVDWNLKSGDVYSTYFADARAGWAVGDDGTILATRDGGEHWQPVSSGTDKNLRVCILPTRAPVGRWEMRGQSLPRVTVGEHWQPESSGTTVELSGVHFTDSRIHGPTGWWETRGQLLPRATAASTGSLCPAAR